MDLNKVSVFGKGAQRHLYGANVGMLYFVEILEEENRVGLLAGSSILLRIVWTGIWQSMAMSPHLYGKEMIQSKKADH